MKRLAAEKVYYEIKECLGEGLTSQVYSAFRKDARGWTQQQVALKIIRSKKNVQVLKQEFSVLSRVKSHYCVQVLAWEVLDGFPALVLEYIDGVTLRTLLAKSPLGEDEIVEIFSQTKKGLQALHRNGVFHGDLNLNNIMINRSGIVKIIDFGFGDGSGGQFVTPQFASPKRKAGAPPDSESDWYSFHELNRSLLLKIGAQEPSSICFDQVKASRRRKLSNLVKALQAQSLQETQVVKGCSSEKVKANPMIQWVVALSFFLITLLAPLCFKSSVNYVELDLRSQSWFRLWINEGAPIEGSFVKKKLRKGQYNLRWKAKGDEKELSLNLNKSQTFLLQPSAQAL